MLFARRAAFLTTASVIVLLLAVLQGAFSWEEWPRVQMGQKQHDSSAVQLQDSNDLSASPQFKRIGAGQQLKESAVRVAQQIKSFVNYLNPSNPPRPGGRAMLPQTVAAQCGEDKVVVTVQRDLFGIGQLIKASDVSLGSCGVTRQDDVTQSVIFEAQLQECGSTLMMVADQLVYSFTLKYQPSRNSNQPIVRTNSAEVGIDCRYMRKRNVSSNALRPTWRPFSSTKSAEGALNFSLKLLADDWLTQRTSNVYFLGDVLNIEASIEGTNHMPLRLFVDSCVATMVPDRNASPRYVFIDNSGCLVDAKVSGSGSRFISPRVQNTKLQLRLDAFRFYSDPQSSIYITCHLKVTAASQNVDSVNKACSFTASSSRWSSVDGSDQVCSCCNTGSCGTGAPYGKRQGREVAGNMVLDWESDARVGPLFIQETLPDLDAPSLQLEAEDRTAQGFPVEVLVLAGVVTAVALGCIAALAAVIYRRPGKPTDLQF